MGDLEFVVSEGANKGRVYPFPRETFVIGSGEKSEIRFASNEVQERHAQIQTDASGRVWVEDLTGKSLLWLNEEPVARGELVPGTFVRLGRAQLVVRRKGGRSGPSGTLASPSPIRLNSPVNPDATARRPTPFAASAELEPSAPPVAQPLLPGTVIDGRYQIIGKLAAGGMGEVYQAQHVELGKMMALKVMLPELSSDQEFVGRFKREAIAASRIGQHNIVDISDFGRTAEGRFYFVMEFLDGVTLSSLLHREGAQAPARVTNIALQIARALAAAHAQGIVHRDLKPDNIMLLQRPGQPDFVKVLDFGVAKVAHGQGQGGHTAVGLVVGTPQYMSPEQAKAVAVDHRSDIYSLGLILYELLCGRPVFEAETPSMLMVKHVTEVPPPLDQAVDVAPEFRQLLFAMLEKLPEARPQSMEEILAVLEGRKRVTQRATPFRPPPSVAVAPVTTDDDVSPLIAPSRSRLPWLIGAAVALLGVGWVAFSGGSGAEAGPPVSPVVPVPDAPAKTSPPAAEAPPARAVDAPAGSQVAPQIRLTFTGVPQRITVSEGDVLLGVTPLSISRDHATVAELTFSAKGFRPLTRKVRFDSEQTIPIELEREAKPAAGKAKPARALADDPYKQEDDLKESPF